MNFNYTDTLEKIYGIEKVNHLHRNLAMSIAGVLLYPTMVDGFNALSAGEAVQELNLFGILPVPYLNYSSSVIPILLAV